MQVRHVTASGSLDEGWEFVKDSGVVAACGKRGSVTVAFNVRVCSSANPVADCYPIKRIDETTWKVYPIKYVMGKYTYMKSCSIHASLSETDGLTLTHAPESTSILLEAL